MNCEYCTKIILNHLLGKDSVCPKLPLTSVFAPVVSGTQQEDRGMDWKYKRKSSPSSLQAFSQDLLILKDCPDASFDL